MKIIENIIKKTCSYVIKTTFDKNYLAQESGSGTSGHLMRYTPPNTTTFNDYYKFIIYPDPKSKGKYRMYVVGWPEYQIVLESDRARIEKYKDTDLQRFEFKIAQNPAIENDSNAEWNYLRGIGVNLNFDFASHGYVYPSSNTKDSAKFKLIPIDIVAPNPNKIQAPIKYSPEDLAPPENYTVPSSFEYGAKTISIEAIPAALINDDDYISKSDQIAISPYYYLKHEKLWIADESKSITLSDQRGTRVIEEYTVAFKSSDYKSVEKTIGHTFDASIEVYGKRTGEVGVSEDGVSATVKDEVGATVKLAYQYKNQTVTINNSSNSQEKTIKRTVEIDYPKLDKNEGDVFLYLWSPVDRYTLYNSKGVVKEKWDYVATSEPTPQKLLR